MVDPKDGGLIISGPWRRSADVRDQPNARTVVHSVVYYACPCLLAFGATFGLFTAIFLLRAIRSCYDAYLASFALSSSLLLIQIAALKVTEYVPIPIVYATALRYLLPLSNWFWYAGAWHLVIMSLERSWAHGGRSSSHRRQLAALDHDPHQGHMADPGPPPVPNRLNAGKAVCGVIQAFLTILFVYIVCLVSVVPQFWSIEAATDKLSVSSNSKKSLPRYGALNASLIARQRQQTVSSPESRRLFNLFRISTFGREPHYSILYHWYSVVFAAIIPTAALLVLTFVLCVRSGSYESARKFSNQHGTGTLLRWAQAHVRLNRLFIVQNLLYLLLVSPLPLLRLLAKLKSGDPNGIGAFQMSTTYSVMEDVFSMAVCFYYPINYLLYCCFLEQYRQTFRAFGARYRSHQPVPVVSCIQND